MLGCFAVRITLFIYFLPHLVLFFIVVFVCLACVVIISPLIWFFLSRGDLK